MKIRFLGTGTSQGVPVIACQCEVCRSTDVRDKRLRSSILIELEKYNIVVDTGPDFRFQMLRAQVTHLDAVLMTHSHKDHIAGLDDVRAFNYLQQASIPIYANVETHEALKREFYYAFSDTKYPGVPLLELREIEAGIPFYLFENEIMPVEVLHYKMPVLGFRIGDFAYITDAKTVSAESRKLLEGVKVIVVNALQMMPHISHFTLEEALTFIDDVNPSQAYLTHISHRFGTHAEIQSLLPPNVFVSFDQLSIEVG
ncbi:MBL fold metallo-hydrolase [Sphingobacterium alkalisoli]|uniref:MBL fold metallo-hydrolase n=1 Tax=Sphingobacterium alkalisoli TaxID=1874115 RepID=A0A4V5LYL1_9SPHI|nr:MBL fold metallo-hydrolase [Sphingobacterium alkalisoli]TJY67019.1 MBL fold metallo-hydrolase [Sphingobacterium alkalisoli]GGH12738.1 hydrolase [Sphingobacterium alkalisoli]